MKLKWMVLMALMVLSMAATGYADAEGSSNALVQGLGNVLKSPVTLLDKMSDSLDSAGNGPSAAEDVAVSDIYNLDAETTG